MRLLERMLLELERPPWSAAWRCLVGFLILACYDRWVVAEDGRGHALALIVWLLGVLVSLKVVPAVLRRTLPLSETVQARWRHERQLGKRYDSYQWRKLFWIGLGMAAYCVYSGKAEAGPASVVLGALVGGGIGLVRWRQIARTEVVRER